MQSQLEGLTRRVGLEDMGGMEQGEEKDKTNLDREREHGVRAGDGDYGVYGLLLRMQGERIRFEDVGGTEQGEEKEKTNLDGGRKLGVRAAGGDHGVYGILQRM